RVDHDLGGLPLDDRDEVEAVPTGPPEPAVHDPPGAVRVIDLSACVVGPFDKVEEPERSQPRLPPRLLLAAQNAGEEREGQVAHCLWGHRSPPGCCALPS